jgi:hypothetical protein
MKKGARLNVLVINVKKAKEFKGKLSRNYYKKDKTEKEQCPECKK